MVRASAVLGRFPALQSPDYRRLFLSTFFTSASRWALMLARSWLVFELTGSSLAVGVVFFAGSAQFIIIGPVAGAVADRMDRRRMVMASLWLSTLCSGALAALTIAGIVEVWQVVALAVVQGWATAVSMPALRAMIPNLVPSDHLLNAVALMGISQHGSRLAGPLLGGVMLAAFGSGMDGAGFVFALSAVVLLFALGQMWRIEYRFAPEPEAAGADSGERMTARALLRETGDGFSHVWNDRRLRMVIALIIPHCSLTMAFNSMLPRLATDVGGGSDTFTAILIGLGVGAIIGTLAVSMVRQQVVQGYTLAVTGVAGGLAMVVMGVATTPATVVLGAVLAGGTQATYMVISQTLVQQIIPDAIRGRVMALFVALAAGHMAFVNLGTGWLADIVSVRPLLIIPGLLWIAIFALAALGLPDLRHVLRRGDFRSRVEVAQVAGDQ